MKKILLILILLSLLVTSCGVKDKVQSAKRGSFTSEQNQQKFDAITPEQMEIIQGRQVDIMRASAQMNKLFSSEKAAAIRKEIKKITDEYKGDGTFSDIDKVGSKVMELLKSHGLPK